LTKDGISTTPLAMKAERRTMQFGTARKPALFEIDAPPAVELGRHLVPPGGVARSALDGSIGFRRKDRSTAFFSHWFTSSRRPPLGDARLAA
jgi:hypothetical protein